MRSDAEPDFPEAWQDPEFAPVAGSGRPQRGKPMPPSLAGHPSDNPGGRQFRGRLWGPAVVLAALFAGFLFDPLIGPMILVLLAGVGLGLAVLVGAMALGMAGSGLFSVGDRVIAWFKRSSEWPED